ncbi:MAG TPA: F0F1 ATP synthase subunit B [Candidatus Omnitrophota bacterium]|nr:F0F1 ATP synthase subunit B [Candidatus Omnitrophota bacterium]
MISTAFAATADAHAAVPFYADAAFWVGVSFVMVVVMAFKPVSRALGAGLDARAAKIKARLDEAHKLREDAQEMLATYQRKQRDAMKEAEDIIAHAKAEAERLSAQAAKDLDEQLKRREAQAMDRIAQAEAQALKEVQNLAVDVAIGAARQVLADNISGAQAAALLDASIQDLPKKFH